MSKAKITLYGLARWCNDNKSDLFSDMLLPEGIDKDILCNNILFRGSEYEVMYPDPVFMKVQIGYWSRRNYRTFDKWIKALNIPYEPLYNLDVYEESEDSGTLSGSKSGTKGLTTVETLSGSYDRTDGYTKSGTGEGSGTSTGSETIAEDITDTVNETDTIDETDTVNETDTVDETDTNNLHSTTTGQTTTENTRSAFDSTTYQPHDKSIVNASSSTDDTGTISKESKNVRNSTTVKNNETVRNSETTRDRDQTTTTTGSSTNSNEYTETNAGTQTDEHSEERNIRVSGTDGENTNEATSGTHTGHRYGNQGITQSQQMLQSELDISKWNIYEHITDLFLRDFVIPIFE